MAKDDTISLTQAALNALIREGIREAMTAKSPDEQQADAMRRLRGQDRPAPPEEIIPCKSPLTGSTFKVRVIMSRTYPDGRIAELIEYTHPVGVNVPKSDGGQCDMSSDRMFVMRDNGDKSDEFSKEYLFWRYTNFWAKDWNEISGQPVSFLAQWRVPQAA